MASQTVQNRHSSGASSPSTPSFAQPTRSAVARSRVAAATPRRVVTNPNPRPPPSSASSGTSSRYDDDIFSNSSHAAAVEAKTGKKVETLYSHPGVKIIAFSATARTAPRNPRSLTKEVLTWSSHLERTIAVGAFKIYRAPGSVAFLNCGSALQPILPKSQCWCLDEESSRFVLQIRRPNYWRIELPLDSSDDCHRAELLKEVLGDILLFEKTACPFERSFTIEISEQPEIIGRRQSWRPSDDALVGPLGPYDRSPNSEAWNRPGRSGSVSSNSSYPLYDGQPSGGYERPGTSHSESSFSEVSEADSDYMDSSYLATPRAEVNHMQVKPLVTNLEEKISAESRRQEWIRKQYVHSLSDNKTPRPNNFADECSDFDDDVSEVGSVVSDLTHVRTMTSRSLYSRQRETTIFEAEDAASRPAQNPSRNVRRVGNEIHEGSGMGGNSVVKKRLRRTGFQASRPPHLNLSGSTSTSPSRQSSRPQSPLGMGYLPPPPLTMAPRPPGLKSHSARARASTTSSRSSTSTVVAAPEKKPERKEKEEKRPAIPPSPDSPDDGFHSVTVGWDAVKQQNANMPPTPPETKMDGPFLDEIKNIEPAKDDVPEPKVEAAKLLVSEVKKEEHEIEQVSSVEEKSPEAIPEAKSLALDTSVEIVEQPKTAPVETKVLVPTATKESAAAALSDDPCPDSPIHRSPSIPNLRQRPRHRTTTSISHRGAFTPLPSAAHLFSPPRVGRFGNHRSTPSQVDHVKNIPWSIMAKTCDLILGPPSNLVKLMLRVAAKIMAGQWRGVVYGRGPDGREIPVKWDYTDPEEPEYNIPAEAMADGVTFDDDVDENGDDYYARGRRLASGRLTPDMEDLD